MKYLRAWIAIVLCAALPVQPARAANTGAILLTLPANARSIAMGDIGTADNSDPSTIFYNPANVCGPTRVYGLVSQQRFEIYNDLWVRRANAGFSGSSPNSPWMVGLDFGYARLSYGTSIVTDNTGTTLDTVQTYEDVASVTMGVGFHAGRVFDMRFGGAVKVWRARFDQQYQATSFDAGVAITLHERYGAWNITPSIGGAMIDAGQDIMVPNHSGDPLPTRVNAGASLCIESSPCNVLGARVPLVAVTTQVEAINPLHEKVEWGIGNEIAIAQVLFVRSGVRRYAGDPTYVANAPTYASWGVGAGVPVGPLRMRFDYSRQANTYDRDHMDALVEVKF
jgi:hypothetical protein